MTGRPVNHQRRADLLDAAVDYAVQHGFAELSWRPVARALGVSTTTLVHHFGTKEQMLEAMLGRLRERAFAATSDAVGDQPDLARPRVRSGPAPPTRASGRSSDCSSRSTDARYRRRNSSRSSLNASWPTG